MPPRFAYWTIIVEGKPTAFRAQDRDDLVPTFKQLQGKHPDAVMMWFSRGRLWTSPDEARAAERRGGAERRGQDWRPGGEHRDPRARFDIPRDEKRRRFAERMRRDERERPPLENRGDRPPRNGRPGGERPWRPKTPDWKPKSGHQSAGASDPPSRGRRPFDNRNDRPPREDWGPRPREDDNRSERPWKKPDWKPRRPPGPPAAKPDWKPVPPSGHGPKPGRPPGAHGPKPGWKPRPPGAPGPKSGGGGGGQGRPAGFRPRGPGSRGPGGRGPGGRGPGGKPPGRGGRGGGSR